MRRAKTLSRAAALFLAAAMTVTSIAPAAFAEDVDVLDVTDLEAGDTGSDEFGYNDSSADLSGSNDDAGAVEGGEVLEEGAVIDDSVGENLTEGSDLGEDAFEVGAAAWSLDNISNDDLFDDPTNETLDVTGDTVSEGQQDLAQAGTPPQVTGLVIELRNKDQSSDYLLWNMVEYVHHYEIHISDSDGVIYGHNISDCPDKERYADEMKGYERIPGYNISGLDGLLGWTADGQEAKDGDKQKKCFEPGKTYSIKVRAVFQNTTEAAAEAAQEGNGNEGAQEEDAQVGQRNNANVSTWTAGPWSDSVNYTAPARKDPKAITGLSWVKQEKVDYYYDEDENHDLAYFTYNEQLQGEIVWSIHTDPDCKEEPVREGSYDTDRTVKLFIDVQNIPAGTYYLRAYNMVGGYFVDESGNIVNNSDYPPEDQKTPLYAKTSFTVTHETVTSPATTGFALLSETNEGFYFTVNPRESADDTIYLQRVEGEVFPDNYPEWINRFANNDNFGKFVAYVSKDGLAAGKTYSFRAITKRKNAADFGTPSDVVKITKAQKPEAISNLAKKSRSTDGYVISFSGNFIPGTNVAPSTNGIQDIEVWVSTDPSFANRTEKGDGVTDVYNCVDNNPRSFIYKRNLDFDFNDHTFIFPERYLEPGKTYYIKARTVINAQQYIVEGEQIKPNPQYRDNTDYATEYGEFSNTLSLTAVLPKAQVYTYAVGKTTITLKMDDLGSGTGFELQRKTGKKWVTLTKTTDNIYKDSGLAVDTQYKYRARTYYYDEDTKAYSYGEWSYVNATTWGAALKLKATIKSKTSVKLSWSKVKGAKGYEVYMSDTTSNQDTVKDGYSDYYSKLVLVKTLSAKKKSYTIKKLTAGLKYCFVVRAYKVVGNKKYYIEDSEYVDLGFNYFSYTKLVKQKDGSKKMTWVPVVGASGYLIESYNYEASKWDEVERLTSWKKSSYTFAANPVKDMKYRISAYRTVADTTEYLYLSNSDNGNGVITVQAALPAPTGVTAVPGPDGSITVSWNSVAGADYYVAYRSEPFTFTTNKTLNGMSVMNGETVTNYVADETSKYGYSISDDPLTATSIVDRKITYTDENGFEQVWNDDAPEEGVTYYYYVVAYAYRNGASADNNYTNIQSSAASLPAKAKITTASVGKTKISKVSAAKKKVTVKWKKVANATGYEVYRSTKKSSGYTKIGDVTKGSTTKFVDTTAEQGKTYYYKVKAVTLDEGGAYTTSANSAAKKVKAK